MELEHEYLQFGNLVRRERERHGLTQEGLAKQIGVRRTTVANIESGRQRVLLLDALKISRILKFSLDKFFIPGDELTHWSQFSFPEDTNLAAILERVVQTAGRLSKE